MRRPPVTSLIVEISRTVRSERKGIPVSNPRIRLAVIWNPSAVRRVLSVVVVTTKLLRLLLLVP